MVALLWGNITLPDRRPAAVLSSAPSCSPHDRYPVTPRVATLPGNNRNPQGLLDLALTIIGSSLRVRIGTYDVKTAVPYGLAVEATDMRCGKIPVHLIGQFAEMATAAMPNETAGWVMWNADLRLAPVTIRSHGRSHLDYERSVFAANEVLVLDCHYHGAALVFFSLTDD
jgi:hypothetical protein